MIVATENVAAIVETRTMFFMVDPMISFLDTFVKLVSMNLERINEGGVHCSF